MKHENAGTLLTRHVKSLETGLAWSFLVWWIVETSSLEAGKALATRSQGLSPGFSTGQTFQRESS
jgi:hypothetical protein